MTASTSALSTNEMIEGKGDLSGASLVDVVRKAGTSGDKKL